MLRVGPDVCLLTTEGSDADIREKYRERFFFFFFFFFFLGGGGGWEAEGFSTEITYDG